MSWHKGPLVAFDTETTGVDVETDRIVTATVAIIRPGAETDVRSHLIAVDVDIPEAATAVHGVTTEHARTHGKPAATVLEAIAWDLGQAFKAGVPVVGMNLAFDLTVLDRELRRNRLVTFEDAGIPVRPVVDALVVDKAVDPYRRGKRQLTHLCDTYKVRIDGAHDAAFDALAAARVVWRIAETHPQISGVTLDELHDQQVVWRREQTDSFGRYLMRQLEELRISRDAAEPGSERRELLDNDYDDLATRIDELDGSWPMRPFGGAR